jgi:hypothetical protein
MMEEPNGHGAEHVTSGVLSRFDHIQLMRADT